MNIDLKKGWFGFLKLCLQCKDENTLAELLDLLLTPEEKENLAARFLIVKELTANKKTQREIAKDLNVSIAKITRGSNALKNLSPNLEMLLKKINNTYS